MKYELETDLEGRVIQWVEEQGGYSLRLCLQDERGWPDQTIFLPDRRIILPELKRPKRNRKSINQEKWVRRLSALGFPTAFCTTLDEVKALAKQ